MPMRVQQHDAIADGIESRLPLAAGELGGVLGPASAKQCPHGGDQLERLGNVGQVAIGAAIQAVHLVLDIDKCAWRCGAPEFARSPGRT